MTGSGSKKDVADMSEKMGKERKIYIMASVQEV